MTPKLYSHGSAILSTLQQVAGAAGVALLVTIMTVRTAGAASRGADEIAAEVAGLHLAFLVAAVIGLVAVALALTLRRTEAPGPIPAGPVGRFEQIRSPRRHALRASRSRTWSLR